MVGRTRQSYYERTWRGKRRALQDDEVLALVRAVRAQMPRLGTRKLYALLHGQFAERELKVGRDKLLYPPTAEGLLDGAAKAVHENDRFTALDA